MEDMNIWYGRKGKLLEMVRQMCKYEERRGVVLSEGGAAIRVNDLTMAVEYVECG